MPSAPPRFCTNCKAIHPGSCPKHKQKAWQGSGHGRGGRPWQRLRKQIFERDGYLCQECQRKGRLTPVELHGPQAGRCDHIQPKAAGGEDTEDNLQTLCLPCDKAKTAADRTK